MLDRVDLTPLVEDANDRERLGDLLTKARSGRPVRELATSVRARVGERDAVSFSTISSWCRGRTVPNPRQFGAFEALLAECDVQDTGPWLAAVERIRGSEAAGPSPYPGLAPFTAEDGETFSGREAVLGQAIACFDRVVETTDQPRVMVIVGASGSGKTSLINAGLLPRLVERGWQPTSIESGSGTASVDLIPTDPTDRSLLVVDRLEQAMRPEHTDAERLELLEAIEAYASVGVVVLALRADFYDDAAQHPMLLRALQTAQVLVGPMSTDDLRTAIERPARVVGSAVPDALIDLVLAEAGSMGEDGAPMAGLLPHLSHALQQTWLHGRRGRMSVADYRAVGGIAGAIEQSAEAAYDELPATARATVRHIFLRLVHFYDDAPLTRRSVPRAEVDELVQARGDLDVDLLEHLLDARLLSINGDRIEVAHEALPRAWPRLQRWITDARDALRTQAGLREATRAWDAGGREEADLARGTALAAYETLAEGDVLPLSADESTFVAASTAAVEQLQVRRRQRVRRLRMSLIGALALAVITGVLAVVAVVAQRDAAETRDNAKKARDEAVSPRIAVVAEELAARDPSVAAQLAVAAYRLSPTREARAAVLNLGRPNVPERFVGGPGARAVVLSPDGSVMATTDPVDFEVVLTQRNSDGVHERAATIPIDFEAYALDISPDGKTLAVGGTNTTVELWNIADLQQPVALGEPLAGLEAAVQGVEFSPDGAELAVVGTGPGVLRWDVTEPANPRKLPVARVPSIVTWAAAYSQDGRWLAAVDENVQLHVFRRGAKPRLVGSAEIPLGRATSVAFSPNGRYIAIGTYGSELQVWDASNPRRLRQIEAATKSFTSYVNGVAFSPDGRFVAAGSSDGTLGITMVGSWRDVTRFNHPGLVTQVDIADDGTMVSASTDGAARVWSTATDIPVTAPAAVYNMHLSSESGRIVVGSDVDLAVFEAPSEGALGAELMRTAPDDNAIGSGGISPDGTTAIRGYIGGRLELIEVESGAVRDVIVRPDLERIVDSAYSADGELVAVVGAKGVVVQELATAAQRPGGVDAPHEGTPQTLVWHSTERLLAVANSDGTAFLYDVEDPMKPALLSKIGNFDSELFAIAFHPGGDIFAAGDSEGTVQLWDISNPSEPKEIGRQLTGPHARLQWGAFSPDGNLLAMTSNAGEVWLWDISDPAKPVEYAVLGPTNGPIYGITFDKSGRHIVAAGADGTVHVWPTDAEEVIERVCATAGDLITEEEWDTQLRGPAFVKGC